MTTFANRDESMDGEAQFVLPGPDGPMSTIHFENMRDGFEDHGYLALLHSLCPSSDQTTVPKKLFAGVQPSSDPAGKSFSEDPQDLRKWRRGVAAAIEAAVTDPQGCL